MIIIGYHPQPERMPPMLKALFLAGDTTLVLAAATASAQALADANSQVLRGEAQLM